MTDTYRMMREATLNWTQHVRPSCGQCCANEVCLGRERTEHTPEQCAGVLADKLYTTLTGNPDIYWEPGDEFLGYGEEESDEVKH